MNTRRCGASAGTRQQRIVVLGSTGWIGRQTLDIIAAFPRRFKVIGLAAGSNTALLSQQMARFEPEFVHSAARPIPGGAKPASMEEMASHPDADLVVVATSGKAGLWPVLAAIGAGKRIALANKEALVMAGEIVSREARANKAEILPVDSEHSAVWQCLRGETSRPSRLFLTASGGPFYRCDESELSRVTPARALEHPVWKMGRKITVDSATLLNKGLEVIEARFLFDIPYEVISILIHPQGLIHSLVEFPDGGVKAQLGFPDMRLPIQYALFYPERLANPALPHVDFSRQSLTLEAADYGRFPCLRLALEAGRKGGTYPAVLCAADEVAVELFLTGKIGFLDIARIVEEALSRHVAITTPSLEETIAVDGWARKLALELAEVKTCCSRL